MSETAAATTRTPLARFSGFLAVALVLHGLLLLLPVQRGLQPEEVLHRLSVSLQAVATRRPVAVPESDQPELPLPAAPVAPAAEPGPPLPEHVTPVAEPPAARESSPPAAPEATTARLLDHAYRMHWQFPEDAGTRRLGEAVPDSGSELRPPGLAGRLPDASPTVAGIEIVDRWLAADGSHNVLLRTPSGIMLCGRAEAWDPLRPLVEKRHDVKGLRRRRTDFRMARPLPGRRLVATGTHRGTLGRQQPRRTWPGNDGRVASNLQPFC
jgi:hypothetical protein